MAHLERDSCAGINSLRHRYRGHPIPIHHLVMTQRKRLIETRKNRDFLENLLREVALTAQPFDDIHVTYPFRTLSNVFSAVKLDLESETLLELHERISQRIPPSFYGHSPSWRPDKGYRPSIAIVSRLPHHEAEILVDSLKADLKDEMLPLKAVGLILGAIEDYMKAPSEPIPNWRYFPFQGQKLDSQDEID